MKMADHYDADKRTVGELLSITSGRCWVRTSDLCRVKALR
jgi:hypothetical protein